jgi:hypothetical protein
MTKQFIRILPFYTQPVVGEPDLEPLLPVALYRSDEPCCEGKGPDSPCDDSQGNVYGIAEGPAAFWCPRHWYEMHSLAQPGQRHVAMTAEQHGKERAAHRARLEHACRHADELIGQAAQWLVGYDLCDQAGMLHQARGAVRASIKGL